jgi:hypothetical protein
MNDQVFVEIYRPETSVQAHLLRDQLEQAGIAARVDGEFLQGAMGGLPLGWSAAPRVLVAESDAAAARKVLEALLPK